MPTERTLKPSGVCLQDVDWLAVIKRLSVAAARLTAPDVFDGISLEDLPSIVVQEFLVSNDQLGWDGCHDLGAFLCGVLKYRFLDRIRRQRRRVAFELVLVEPTQPAGFDKEVEAESTLTAVRTAVQSNPEAEGLVRAASSHEFSGGYNQNQELADILNVPIHAVVRVRKKIARDPRILRLKWETRNLPRALSSGQVASLTAFLPPKMTKSMPFTAS